MKFLIVDKRKRIGDLTKLAYVLERLSDELKKLDIEHVIAYYDEINLANLANNFDIQIQGESLKNFTHVILRGHRTKEEYRIKKMITDFCLNNNIKLQNSSFMKMLHSYDKLTQMQIMTQNGISYLDSFYSIKGDYANNDYIKNNIGYPFVLKHAEGVYDIEVVNGEQKLKKPIHLIYNDSDLENIAKEDELSNFFVQKFATIGEDFRIILQNDRILTGFKRVATNSFITVREGEYYPMTEAEIKMLEEISIKTARAFNSDFCALDIIMDNGKPYVLEINMNPGFKAMENKIDGTYVNIAEAMIKGMLD